MYSHFDDNESTQVLNASLEGGQQNHAAAVKLGLASVLFTDRWGTNLTE